MIVKVQNIRGVERAAVAIDKVVLLAGGNRAGKTSILQGLAMVASRQKTVPGYTQAQTAALLIRDGEDVARVELASDDGEASLELDAKTGKITLVERGAPPFSPLLQVARLSQQPPKARIETLRALLRIDADTEALAAALQARPLVKNPDTLVKRVEADGWDKVADDMAADARAAKAEWQKVANQRWSQQRGASWRPDNMPAEPEGANVRLEALDEELAGYLGGMGEEMRQHLEAQVAKAADAAKQQTALKEARDAAQQPLVELEAQVVAAEHPMSCPACGVLLRIKFGKLVEDDVAVDMAEQEARIADARKLYDAAQQSLSTIESDIRAGEAAKRKLAEAGDRKAPPAELVEARARAALEVAAVQAKVQADEWQGMVERRLDLAELLGPEGLRQEVLAQQLAALCEQASVHSRAFGLGVTLLSVEGEMRAGEHAVEALSRSEQYLADVAVQLALGDILGADLVVLDDADVLEARWRSMLFEALVHYEAPVVVGMMSRLKRKDGSSLVPDLGQMGVGETLWVADGRVMPLAAALEDAR